MPVPDDLHVVEHPPVAGWSDPRALTVVLVHGTLDRGASFNRVVRRVRSADRALGVLTYDRRGYGASRSGPPAGFDRHVEDLLELAGGAPTGPPVVAVGHSLGGALVLAAAGADPTLFRAVGAYEPPLPWQGFRRPRTGPPSWAAAEADPAEEAERFFRRMVSDEAWGRLPARAREERRADGPALLADLRSFGGRAPFELTGIKVPVVFGRGGPGSQPHHRRGTAWAAQAVPGAKLVEIRAAGHGAHLSHPGAFTRFVLEVLAADPEAGGSARP